MTENNNENNIIDKETKPVEKIGFNTPINDGDNATPGKKKTKFSNQRKSKLQKTTFGFFIASTISSIATLSFLFMPALSGLAGAIAMLIITIIILIPILVTIFTILISEGFRQFVGNAYKVGQWFFDAANHVIELSPYYPYVAFPTIAVNIIEIVLCVVTINHKQKGVVTYLIVTVLLLLTSIILTIFYYINGMKIFQ